MAPSIREEEQHAGIVKPIPKIRVFSQSESTSRDTGTRRRHGSRGPPPGMLRGLVVLVVATLVSNPIRVAAITTKNVNVG